MKKIFLFTLFLVSFVYGANLEVSSSTKKAMGEGYGKTYEDALIKALSDAVGRMYGGKLSAKSTFITDSKSVNSDKELEKNFNDQIRKISGGSYDSYNVISSKKTQEGYNVIVSIKKTTTTKKYKAPGLSADSRRSISVFNSTANTQYKGIGDALQQKIITDLLDSRKFNVLDRDSKGYYDLEKALIKSGDAHGDEVYKLGNVLGSDYMLLFAVTGIDGSSKKSNPTSKTKNKVEITIDYRVLLFATRQIKFSNSLAMEINLKDGSLGENEKALDSVAQKISSDILNAIYPLKVASVTGDEVIFSQKLNEGETYECFALGERIKDSYTKETTGRVENKVGEVNIVRVNPKMSYAKITQGAVKKGNLCRPLSVGNTGNGYTIGKDANYKLEEDGGVNLGF